MNNTEHFGKLTERMQAFREEVLDAKPYIDAQRAVLATEAYKENQNQPRVMVRALMLQKILEGMSIYIDDKSLIAGNLSLIHISEPTRRTPISYAVFCLKKKKKNDAICENKKKNQIRRD